MGAALSSGFEEGPARTEVMKSDDGHFFVLKKPLPTDNDPADTEFEEAPDSNSAGWPKCPACEVATSMRK